MTVLRTLILAMLLLAMVGCKEKAPTRSLDEPYDGGNSVYEQGASTTNELDALETAVVETDDYSSDYTPAIATEGELESIVISDHDPLKSMVNEMDWSPIFFSFDASNLTVKAKQQLTDRARALLDNTSMSVLLEGHCDSRGTDDYNLALGERRAQAVKRYLEQLGVPSARLKTMSYGKMKPLIPGETETAWLRNRRVAFTF